MASFVEVMSWFKKMHECNRLLPNCGNCPMGTGPISKCRKMLHERAEECERVIEQYAETCQKPEFPTWKEWQRNNFPEAVNPIMPCEFASYKSSDCEAFKACADCRNRPIPAKVAQVLGIEPVRTTTIKQSP